MAFQVFDLDAAARSRVIGDAVRAGKGEAEANVKLNSQRWAVDADRDSYLVRVIGMREAYLYWFFANRQLHNVWVDSWQGGATRPTLVMIQGIELDSDHGRYLQSTLAEAFGAHGLYGFGQMDSHGRPTGTGAIIPQFVKTLPG